jgi:hypothetical protein
MCGWLSEETARASRSKRARASGGVGEVGRQDLDGDFPRKPRVAGKVDLAHPARIEQRNDFIRAQSRARGQSHERTMAA